jgi:quinol monooxygenase YgiN
MIVIAGTIAVKPERQEEARQRALRMAEATQNEVGCITYQFYADLADPNIFFIFEEWETEDALNKHFQTEHMKEFQQHLPGLLAGGLNVKRYTVQSVTKMG